MIYNTYILESIYHDHRLDFNFDKLDASISSLSEISNISIYGSNSQIVIKGAAIDEYITVYNITGEMREKIKASNDIETIDIESGVYFVKVGGQNVKVIL